MAEGPGRMGQGWEHNHSPQVKYGGGQGYKAPPSHPDKGTQLAGAPAARSHQTQHLFVGSSPPPLHSPGHLLEEAGGPGGWGGLGSQLPHGDRTPHPAQCCGGAIWGGGSAANHITSLPPGCKVPPSAPSPSRAWGAPPCHWGQRRPPPAGEVVGAGAGHGPPPNQAGGAEQGGGLSSIWGLRLPGEGGRGDLEQVTPGKQEGALK